MPFQMQSSNICAAFYTISTDGVLAQFLCISRASWFPLTSNELGSHKQENVRNIHVLHIQCLFTIIGMKYSNFLNGIVKQQ